MRKGLNNKGFTLVELLAVVVILALVMGIAASSMLSTMNSSRRSTLHSAAQTAASNLNNWVLDDMLAMEEDAQKLGNDFIKATQTTDPMEWICLDDSRIKNVHNKGKEASLLDVLGLNSEDVVIGTTGPGDPGSYSINDNTTCSALRYNTNTGGYEFLLVAVQGGKYYVAASDDGNYAFSRASGPEELITD